MKTDGGSAFPIQHVHPIERPKHWIDTETLPGFHGKEGMSLRDYFAAHSLQALHHVMDLSLSYAHVKNAAKKAYELADAMLEERAK